MNSNPNSEPPAAAATPAGGRTGWWTAAIYTALVISIAAAGVIYLRSQLAEARRKVETELNAIADLKVQQIANWRRERFGDAAFFGQAAFVARDVKAFFDDPSSPDIKAELVRWMTLLKGGDRYSRVSLFDAKGELRLMLPDDSDRPGPMKNSYVADVLRDPRVEMTDLHRGDSGNIHLNLAIPVFAPATPPVAERASVQPASVQPASVQPASVQPASVQPAETEAERWRVQLRGQTITQPASPPIAVILLELDPRRFLYPIVQSWLTPSRTAETLLVKRDGDDALFLNELRHHTNTALSFRVPLSRADAPAVRAALGQVGTREGVDYRGVPVLAAVRAVPDSPWFMVAKVDQEEIYAPLRERAWAAGWVAMALALAGGLGLLLLWRGRETAFLRHDLAQRRQAEAALRQERDFSNAALDSLPGVFYCYDENRKFRRWNKNFERVTGYSAEEIARMSPLDFFAGAEKELLAARIQEVFDKGISDVEADFVSKDGTRTPYYFTGLTTLIEGRRHLVGVGVDITARRRAEAERDRLFNLSVDMLCIAGLDGFFKQINPAWSRTLGWSNAELLAKPWLECVHPDDRDRTVQALAQLTASQPVLGFENRYRCKDGAYRWISWNTFPLPAEGVVFAVARDVTGQKQAEHERQRFVLLAESSSEFIGMCDLNLQPLYINPAGIRMVGLPDMAAACRVKVQDYFFPEDQRFIAEEFFPRVMREGHGDVEIRLRHFQTGEPIWMFYYLFSVRDASGKAIGWATVSRDITERKQAEAALWESEQRLTFALQQSHTGGWNLDLVDHTAHRTLEHDRIFGYETPLPQWTYEMFLEHVLPEDRAEVDRRFHTATATQSDWSFECRIRRQDGVVRWIWAAGGHQRDAAGQPRRMAGIVQDITERKEAEAALHESEERLRLALDAARMGTFDWDVPGNRITWSRWHEELWGFKPGEFGGTYEAFSGRVHPDDMPGINAEVARCIAARAPWFQEFRVVWPDGSEHWILGQGEFTFAADGQPLRMRGVVKEVTERKEAEAALHALAERLQRVREEERTRIAREVHDVLGQLLTGLTMDMTWLQKRLPKIADVALQRTMTEKLGEINQLTDSMIRTVQEISSELRPSVLDNLGLAAAIHFEAGRFQKRSGIACEVVARAEQLPRDAERDTALFRIFQEVLTNVARHAQATRVEIRLAGEQGGGELVLTVNDNGRGIEPEKLAGTKSLGLLGMSERAAQLGGRIEFASEPGKGTTVTLRVPMK